MKSAGKKKGKPNPPILDAFRAEGNGSAEYKIHNLYVYFWRWATWEVFDSDPGDRTGVVCFISPSGYIRGPGFKGMREYLRRTCSDGWIIDASPERMQPDVPTRIFPGVQQPLATGVFVREPDTDKDVPARIKYRAVHGTRGAKQKELLGVSLGDEGWRSTRTDWQASLTPAPDTAWDECPSWVTSSRGAPPQ